MKVIINILRAALVIGLIWAAFALASCDKQDCNCGMILDDNVWDYSIKVRNDCSGNVQWFQLEPGDWMHAHVGNDICLWTTW